MTRSSSLRLLGALVAMAVVGVAPARAETGSISGPAAGAIGAYLKDTRVACFTPDGKDARCAIADIGTVSRVDYGAFTGQPAPVAVAFVDYQEDPTGQMVEMMAIVFRESGGRWAPVGRAMEILGRNPHTVRFGAGTIFYQGQVVPSGGDGQPVQRPFVLTVSDRGVAFAPAHGR